MTWFMQARLRAAVLFTVPVLFLVGVALQPYIDDYGDSEEVAEKVATAASRYAWAQLVLVISLAFTFLAFFGLRMYLRGHGEDRWSVIAVPFMVIGGSTMAFASGGTGIGAWVTQDSGGSLALYFDSASDWILGIEAVGGTLAAVGIVAMAIAIARSGVLRKPLNWIVVVALFLSLSALVRGVGSLSSYVAAVTELVAFWILGVQMWREAKEEKVHPLPQELRAEAD